MGHYLRNKRRHKQPFSSWSWWWYFLDWLDSAEFALCNSRAWPRSRYHVWSRFKGLSGEYCPTNSGKFLLNPEIIARQTRLDVVFHPSIDQKQPCSRFYKFIDLVMLANNCWHQIYAYNLNTQIFNLCWKLHINIYCLSKNFQCLNQFHLHLIILISNLSFLKMKMTILKFDENLNRWWNECIWIVKKKWF